MKTPCPRNKRGSALVQVLVFIMILALMAAMSLQLILGRSMAAEKAASAAAYLALSQGANNQLNGCLSNVTQVLCNSATAAGCGFPLTATVENQCKKVTANLQWISGSCKVAIHVSNC